MSDKPAYMQALAPATKTDMKTGDAFRQHQYETLLSVDDWVGAILQALVRRRRLQNTLIVFMSDNGHPIGEHRLGGPATSRTRRPRTRSR